MVALNVYSNRKMILNKRVGVGFIVVHKKSHFPVLLNNL